MKARAGPPRACLVRDSPQTISDNKKISIDRKIPLKYTLIVDVDYDKKTMEGNKKGRNKMTKKHFKAFAETIKQADGSRALKLYAAGIVIHVSKQVNQRFDEERFLVACGLKEKA